MCIRDRSLGFVEDVELNLEKGTIEAIIIPAERGFMGLFPRGEDLVIRWRDIKRIGDDVILVDFSGVRDGQYLYELSLIHIFCGFTCAYDSIRLQ